jgi:hypothetical protein
VQQGLVTCQRRQARRRPPVVTLISEGNADLRAAFEFAVRLQKSGISGRRKPSELLANDDRRCGHRQAARSIRVDRAQVLRIGVKNRLIAYLTSPAKTGKTLSGSLSVAQNGRADVYLE